MPLEGGAPFANWGGPFLSQMQRGVDRFQRFCQGVTPAHYAGQRTSSSRSFYKNLNRGEVQLTLRFPPVHRANTTSSPSFPEVRVFLLDGEGLRHGCLPCGTPLGLGKSCQGGARLGRGDSPHLVPSPLPWGGGTERRRGREHTRREGAPHTECSHQKPLRSPAQQQTAPSRWRVTYVPLGL